MRPVFIREGQSLRKQFKNYLKFINNVLFMFITLKVFLKIAM